MKPPDTERNKMDAYITAEINMFAASFLCGAVICAAYDIVRAFVFASGKKTVSVFLDIMFFIAAGIAFFEFTRQLNHNYMRSYIVIGAACGALIYLFTVSRLLYKLFCRTALMLIRFLRRIMSLIAIPMRYMSRKIANIMQKAKITAKIQKEKVKNLFHFKRKDDIIGKNKVKDRRVLSAVGCDGSVAPRYVSCAVRKEGRK